MKRMFVLAVLIIYITFLTGCWDSQELNELAIVTAMGIDKSEEGYLISVQMINPGQVSSDGDSSQESSVVTHRSSGKTVFEALRRLKVEIPRKIYLAHLRAVIFGEELAEEEGIGKSLDFISRDHEIRTDFYITIAKDVKAEELLNILTPIEQIPANNIYKSLEVSEKIWGSTFTMRLDELIETITSTGKELVLTGAIKKGYEDVGMDESNLEKVDVPTTIQLRNLSVFKKDKLIGWLSEEESIGYNYVVDNIKSTIETLSWQDDGTISIEIMDSKAKIKGNVKEGKPKITIEVKVEANIGEVESKVDLLDAKNVYIIEELLEKGIGDKMKKVIERTQTDFKSDIFGFGDELHRSNPKEWKAIEKDWDNEFPNLEVDVKVDAKIRRLGTIMESFQKEIDK